MTARTDHERAEFEKWLGIKPCGAAHDFGWAAWKARAALSYTPEAVKQSLTTDAVLPETDAWIAVYEDRDGNSKFYTTTHKDLAVENDTSGNPQPLYTDQQVRALLATGGQAQAVASIYVTEDGQSECEDWKVPLPVGRNLLYAAPQAQADARCVSCNYQHGHAIGCENNPVDIALKNNAAAIAAAKGEA